jgi:Na+/H+ antiporter NhaD/arsenite permease-like protein
MKRQRKVFLLILLIAGICGFIFLYADNGVKAQDIQSIAWITGTVYDKQNQPVSGALVELIGGDNQEKLVEASTQKDGRYTLAIPDEFPDSLTIHIERAHFKDNTLSLSSEIAESLRIGKSLVVPDVILVRKITPAFWIATLIFIAVLVLIATGYYHNTLAALVGTALLFLVSYLGEPIYEGLYIFNFSTSLSYIDWNVIFLIMGMMIVIAVVEATGIFQWLAFFAYRVSGGRMWLLLPVLMLITGIASAFLDNVTTMLLMTPISVQIALSLGVNPLAFLIPEVLASNVIGVSTLVGTPTNILIGSYGNISFNDFLQNLTPGVILAFIGLVVYSWFSHRKELSQAHDASELLLAKLEERAKITEPENLKKAGWIGAGMLAMFIFGEHIHLQPAVTAIIGATGLMVWIRPNIDEMIDAVDWTTLVFFMSLFIVVGSIQEVGLISYIADWIGRIVGDNLTISMLVVIWVSAVLSMVIANIPFTAAMLPVVGFLSATIPGAESKVLFFCLSVGSAMGGNGSLIGASANMVTAGIAESAGFPISYTYFMKKGLPALIITIGLASLWLLIKF